MDKSNRSRLSRWAEHKPGTRRMVESWIKEHTETIEHDVQFNDVQIHNGDNQEGTLLWRTGTIFDA